MSAPPFANIDDLVQRLLDDQIEPDEMKRLEKAILEDSRVRDYYIDSLLVCAVMRRSSQVTGDLSRSDLMHAISSGSEGDYKRFGRRMRSVAAILLFAALVSVSVYLFRHIAQGPAIGAVTGVYEAQWQGTRPRAGGPLYGGLYTLREGAAKMELGQGTSLLLEAPCQVELTGIGEVMLRSGRLVASVSGTNGFRVRTLTALITDLGTEFGVIARADGSTEAHVLQGQISVALNPERSSRATSLIINENQAATVDANGQTIQGGLAARPDVFLLALPRSGRSAGAAGRLSLADIVGGGNGRGSGSLNRGIDVQSGEAFKHPPTAIRRTRKNAFAETPQFRGIDGVFVPNGSLGPVVISSTGLTFAGCPATLGSYYGGPANSGRFFDIPSQHTYMARLNGVSFGTSRRPALNLHPNAGITFDLEQIRRDNPNITIGRFSAVCGIPKDAPQSPFSSADVWVLLDGVVCLHLRYPEGMHVVEKVDVPIPADARFLTLASTCTGRADYSWVFFGDPFLGPAAAVHEEVYR